MLSIIPYGVFMLGQIAIQNILNKALEEQFKKNPRTSQRAFAKKLDISQGALSEILDGKRSVSFELAEKILTKLNLDPQEKLEILKYFSKPAMKSRDQLTAEEKEIGIESTAINDELFRKIDWTHHAILSMIKLSDFNADPHWIADRLGLDEIRIRTALTFLTANNFIRIHQDGMMERIVKKIKPDADVSSESIQNHHKSILQLGEQKLDLQMNDFTSSIFAADMNTMDEAKLLIRRFHNDLGKLMEKTTAGDVCQLSIQLYPLTKNLG